MVTNAGRRSQALIGAVLLFALVVLPLAVANAAGGGEPQAGSSASVKKKIKKLTTQANGLNAEVDGLNQEIADLKGEQGDARPPSGPAAGDLNGSYPNPTIGSNAVGAAEVTDNSLTGADILESTLGDVPSATSANFAGTASEVNGLGARSFEYSGAVTGVPTTLSNHGGLRLQADCDSPVNVRLLASTTVDNSYLSATSVSAPGPTTSVFSDTNFDISEGFVEIPLAGSGVANLVYRQGSTSGSDQNSEDAVTVTLGYHETGSICQVAGTSVGGPA